MGGKELIKMSGTKTDEGCGQCRTLHNEKLSLDCGLLGCNNVYFCRWSQMFQWNVLPPS